MSESTEQQILQNWEIGAYVEPLNFSNLEDIGKKSWFEYHKKLMHLNQQSIFEISNMRHESVKEWFVTFKKIPVLVSEAIQISVWKQKIFPLLINTDEEFTNTFMIYSVFLHENIAVSLLENLLFHSDSVESIDDSTIDLIDYSINYITSLIFSKNDPKPLEFPIDSALFEVFTKKSEIEFDISIKCISIIGCLAHCIENLPLAFLKRLLSTHDIPYLFSQLIEKKPWLKSINGEKMIYTSNWEKMEERQDGKISKIEGQIWICLRELLLNPKCAPYYQITEFRMSELMKLQKYLHENVLDQISPLIDLRRWLSYLSISSQGVESKTEVFVELVPQIRSSIIGKHKKKWKQLANTQFEFFYTKDMDYIKETAEVLSSAYDLEKMVIDEKYTCALCGKAADKKCSRCKSVWYCGRECQITDWSSHKSVCEKLNQKLKADD